MPPRFVHHHGYGIGEIEASVRSSHWHAYALLLRYRVDHTIRQAARLGPEDENVICAVLRGVIALHASRRYREQAVGSELRKARGPVIMYGEAGEIGIIETGSQELTVTQCKTERPHEMQARSCIGGEP